MMNLILLTTDLTKCSPTAGFSGQWSSLFTSYKDIGEIIVGIGFCFYGLYVVRKLVTSPNEGRSSLITFFIALLVFLGIWALLE
ncbi:MAG: hypothetical protein MJZ34_00275 [Paludibacteraceae bacterium]|nr:hypothetical protein [Paludibacteraceae bacterium]